MASIRVSLKLNMTKSFYMVFYISHKEYKNNTDGNKGKRSDIIATENI